MTTIRIFQQMFDHLVANKMIHNQTELARAAGVNEVTVSRILNGQVRKAKQETLWKVNTTFGNIFNPEWLRGDSDIMLAAELQSSNPNMPAVPSDVGAPTSSSLVNAALAAKDEIITILRSQLTDKDALIESKERCIEILQQQIFDLRNPK